MELVRTKIRTCTSTNVRIVGRDSSVFIATSYGLDGPGIESRRGGGGGWIGEIFHNLSNGNCGRTTMCAGSFPGVKRPVRGVDLSPHLAPRLKEESSYTSAPLWAFVACSW